MRHFIRRIRGANKGAVSTADTIRHEARWIAIASSTACVAGSEVQQAALKRTLAGATKKRGDPASA
jgi:hypothetical protein